LDAVLRAAGYVAAIVLNRAHVLNVGDARGARQRAATDLQHQIKSYIGVTALCGLLRSPNG